MTADFLRKHAEELRRVSRHTAERAATEPENFWTPVVAENQQQAALELLRRAELVEANTKAPSVEIDMIKNGTRPVHPGEILREEYLVPLKMSVDALAGALRVPPSRIDEIVSERQGISADTALRLSRYFGTTPELWLNLQMAHDLRRAMVDGWERIAKEIEPFETA